MLIRKMVALFRALVRKEKLHAQMDEEMRAHIELGTKANIYARMNPKEARLAVTGSLEGRIL